MLMNKLRPKLKDLGSFTIPCSIGNHHVGKALCDLGASINLMPMFDFKNLGIGKARPTIVTLQLVDHSCAHLEGKIEDVLWSRMTEELGELIETKRLEDRPGKSFEYLDLSARSFKPPRPSIEEPPALELKPLLLHLKDAYLGNNNTLPVVISVELTPDQETKLLDVLRRSKRHYGGQ
ncbi:gag-asp_proteas domain-containing protein [Gossypium australe]|uniref:Gag-asp_proteas domain-containing protein n=1 Tax=Gossypium australe TaxID=47621 RepID=A0A5B6WF16_9ROSI|nr:gag-asp_proteas domain-containing protein [Gossypium australe]